MKKSLQILFAVILLTGYNANVWAHNSYYWIGGTGNWSDGSKWLRVSGDPLILPSSLPLLPTVHDDVIFNAASFSANNQIITVDVAAFANRMDWTGIDQSANIIINQRLTISGSLTLSPNVYTIDGRKEIRTITGGPSGAIIFTSNSVSTTIRTFEVSFDVPVTFDGANGKWILQDNMTLNHSARFVNGHVVALPAAIAYDPALYNTIPPPTNPTEAVTGTSKLIFGVTATVSGARHASHVIGYTEKVVIKDSPEFEFPIGNGTYYRPLISNVSSSDNNLLARYLSVAPVKPVPTEWSRIVLNAPLNSVSDREFWYFDGSSNSSPGVRMNATHPDPAIAAYYALEKWQGLTVAGLTTDSSKPPRADWHDQNATVGGVTTTTIDPVNGFTNYWVKASGVSNSVNWITIARRGSIPLPVRLVSFTAQQIDGQVQLKWQSVSEENTEHFVVEKSQDGKIFSPVLTRKAQGNSTALVSYSAIDNSPLTGTSYYRLKMVDQDQTFAYSNIVAVNAAGNQVQVRAYPNPSRGNGISITAANGSKLVLKTVSDMFGKQVGYQVSNASGDGLQVNFTQNLPAGFYVATLATADTGELTKVKFVVQ